MVGPKGAKIASQAKRGPSRDYYRQAREEVLSLEFTYSREYNLGICHVLASALSA